MEFGLFTEFASPPGVSEAAAFDESLGQMKAAEEMGFDAVWLARNPFPERSIGTCVPSRDRIRAGGPHAARQDRDRRPGPSPEPPLAPGRGRRDGGPYLQGPARIRRWAKRTSRALSGLQHPVQRESRSVPGDARHSDQGMDPGALLAPRKVLSVPGRLHHAQALSEATSPDAHRRHDAGDLPAGGTARSSGVRGGPHGGALGPQATPADLPRGVERVGASGPR